MDASLQVRQPYAAPGSAADRMLQAPHGLVGAGRALVVIPPAEALLRTAWSDPENTVRAHINASLVCFYRGRAVEPYRVYKNPEQLAVIAACLGLGPTTPEAVAARLNDFLGFIPAAEDYYHVDPLGVYQWRTANPVGKYTGWIAPPGTLDKRLTVAAWLVGATVEPRIIGAGPYAPWYGLPPIAVVAAEPVPTWMDATERVGDEDIPNPRFAPLVQKMGRRCPDHLIFPVSYV